MSSIHVTVPHRLSKHEAAGRIKKLFTELKEEQKDVISNVQEEWGEDTGRFSFSARGFDLSGMITVHDNDVVINGKLPFALSFFQGKIKSLIAERAEALLK